MHTIDDDHHNMQVIIQNFLGRRSLKLTLYPLQVGALGHMTLLPLYGQCCHGNKQDMSKGQCPILSHKLCLPGQPQPLVCLVLVC